MREKVLRDLASRAATDAGFLKQARRDLEGTLAGFGYDLSLEELRLVDDLRRRTAAMSDEELDPYAGQWPPRAYRRPAGTTCGPGLAWFGSG